MPRRRSLWAMASLSVLIGGMIVAPSNSPLASAGDIRPMSCPDGSVAVEIGYGIPPLTATTKDPDVTAQGSGGLLCQWAFTADGTFSTPTGVTSADVFLVGGGGGGGAGGVIGSQILAGGGGGGGQVALFENVPVTGDISVTVGTGGAGGRDLCDPTCHTGGDDGTEGGYSVFGTGNTYVARGGGAGTGGSTAATTPFLAAGDGGLSASAPDPSPVPVGVTATVSDGGDGTTGTGALMGPSPEVFFSGAGGGAGAGGAAFDAELTGCITIDSSNACTVAGGDGGIGFLPEGQRFDYSFWDLWFPFWSCNTLLTCMNPYEYGFGPGGGGATAGLYLYSTGYSSTILDYGRGSGTTLDGTHLDQTSTGAGQGATAFGDGIEGGTPYELPTNLNSDTCPWSECFVTTGQGVPGGGGGGGVGNTSVFAPEIGNPDAWNVYEGSAGVDGIVIVLAEVPVDNDGDGYLSDVDCNDDLATINPGATELVGNGYDDDCNVATPIDSDATLTCDITPAPAPTASIANDFLGLKFPAPNDLGSHAAVGDTFRYTSVAAVGGPHFDTGQITAVSGAGPWTVTLTVSDTTGITAGDGVTAVANIGNMGDNSIATVSNVVDSSTLELTVDGSNNPSTGSVSNVRTGQLVDATVTVSDLDTPDTLDIDPVDISEFDASDNANLSTFLSAQGGREGTVTNIAGSGPWTADITGLADTAPFQVGDQIVQADFDGFIFPTPTGSIGSAGIYTITSVGTDSISFTAEGGSAPYEGTVGYISTWSSVEYSIDFFESETDTPIELQDVGVTVKDIDEFQFLEIARPDSFRIERATDLEVLTHADTAEVPVNSYRFWSGVPSDSTDTPHWVEANYDTVSTMKIRVGALSAGMMYFGIAFRSETFTDPVSCATTLVNTVPTTTTYTGDTGSFDPGDSLTLSATVDPDTCTDPAVTYELTYPDATTATVTSPLDTTGFAAGTYTITADYAGSDTCDPSSDTAEFVIRQASTTTYTGDSGIVLAGTSVTLSANVTPSECTGGDLTYEVLFPDGTTHTVTNPLDTTGFGAGIYEITAYYSGDDLCLPSADSSLLVIATPGDSTTGGGVYQSDAGTSGSPRVHFGFTVQKTDKYDKRTATREVIQRGQLLWINNTQWRLKASLYSRQVTVGGVTTGDRPVFGLLTCPAGVGTTGSNPKCGVIVGGGWLQRWNPDTLEWETATDLGRSGWVSFSATIYDGGTVKVCKGKTCSIVDVADWFGMTMAGITAAHDDVPVGAPLQVKKQRNAGIVIRV